MIRQTHTHVNLELPTIIFRKIREKLDEAGYEHAFTRAQGQVVLIDMHGIALIQEPRSTTSMRLEGVIETMLEQAKAGELASMMSCDQLRGAFCEICARVERGDMESAVIGEVNHRLQYPWSWWLRRLWDGVFRLWDRILRRFE